MGLITSSDHARAGVLEAGREVAERLGKRHFVPAFSDAAYVVPVSIITVSLSGAIYQCAVIYHDQKKQPSEGIFHEWSIISVDQ
jgi:hypothetical protein